MVFEPTDNPTLDGEPDVAVAPFTVIIAVGSGLVGVTLIDGTATPAVYDVVVVANTGLKVPELMARLERPSVRVTVRVYAWVVEPSPAVTTILMVLLPSVRGILAEGKPEVTVVPFTVTVAVRSAVVGVTVIDGVITEAV